ncbi:peptidoglycan-binding protein, partial [Candidatus Parcubacteria bacterium]|nr:peptidoglycan-binding protein [Candidatus Parcubacteria bacterium]
MKIPHFNQWQRLWQILNFKEKIVFLILLFLFFNSLFLLAIEFYLKNTKLIPKEGGEIVEGIIGEIRVLNPIFASLEAEKDVIFLLYSPLFEVKEREIVPRLAENYEILDNGKTIKVNLKENIFWEDGKEIEADDVIFTIQLIQNPETKSWYKNAWSGVEVEKISEKSLVFKLKTPSFLFLENLNLRPIPKHYFEKIPPEKLLFHPQNINPLSSGPFAIEKIFSDKEGKIKEIILKRNEKYFGKKPYLERMRIRLIENEEELLKLAKKREIDTFSFPKREQIFGFQIKKLKFPRYFALFFNLNSELLKEKPVREAISLAINKKEIVKDVFYNEGEIVVSPFNENLKEEFSPERAMEILNENGYLLEGEKRVKTIKEEPTFVFKKELKVGDKGEEVKELQKCLAKFEDVYPEKEITGYFGNATKKAVMRFQEKFQKEILEKSKLTQATGIVGDATREKLNEICFEKKEQKKELSLKLVTGDSEILKKIANHIMEDLKRIGIEVSLETKKIEELELEIIPQRKYDLLLFGSFFGKLKDPYPFFHSSQIEREGLNLSNFSNEDADKILISERETFDEKKRKELLEKF